MKRGSALLLVVSDDDADRVASDDERDVQRRRDAESPRELVVDLGIVDERVHALASPALKHSHALRGARDLAADERLDGISRGGTNDEA